MKVVRLEVGPLQANCWIVWDADDGPAVVIDPGGDAELIVAELDGRDLAYIILTHGHFDHLGGAEELRSTGAQLAVHRDDATRVMNDVGTGGVMFGFGSHVTGAPDIVLTDGQVLRVGALRLEILHTPGHTEGGICVLASEPGATEELFSGDTLFAGSVGRTDFPGGDSRALSRSIAEKLAPLAPETVVHPGHGPDTTIGREARINPFWPRA